MQDLSRLNFAAALICGLTMPLVVEQIVPMMAIPQSNLEAAAFADRDWRITVVLTTDGYTYSSLYKPTRRYIYLSGGKVSGDFHRRVYTWNHRGTIYQVTWQPNDSSFARVRVKTPRKELLNRLLPRVKYLPSDAPADL